MREIPRDGKSYLAWHKQYGSCFVSYNEFHGTFVLEGILTVMSGTWTCVDHLTRWMDEKGKWHEVNDERVD